MSSATNKATVRRYYEQVLSLGRVELVEEFLAENIELHGTDLRPGMNAVSGWVAAMVAAFPDRQTAVEEVIAEGDRVVVRSTFTGTHQGEMKGIPATGRSVTQPAITIFRMANGKIAEGWYAADHLSMMQQLGVIPTPQAA
jgi:steroid delta-isomerase-like uncharacterized protein